MHYARGYVHMYVLCDVPYHRAPLPILELVERVLRFIGRPLDEREG